MDYPFFSMLLSLAFSHVDYTSIEHPSAEQFLRRIHVSVLVLCQMITDRIDADLFPSPDVRMMV
jgi:hypothetical protein